MLSEDDYRQMYRDFYFGSGKDNPSVTMRLAKLDADMSEVCGDVTRHSGMLEGEKGLDRLIRDFLAEQKGRASKDALFRWLLGIGVTALVGFLEWHPWR
jgi:hypothetical protein